MLVLVANVVVVTDFVVVDVDVDEDNAAKIDPALAIVAPAIVIVAPVPSCIICNI